VALPGGIVFAGLSDGTLMRSGDRGQSWERLPARAAPILAIEAAEG